MGGYMALKLLFLLGIALLLCDSKSPANYSEPATGETVVLLHGMGRSRLSMSRLGRRLKKQGYQVKNFPYTQIGSSMDELSAKLKRFIEEEVETPHYHLVAHSLGNIIIRNGFRDVSTHPFREGLGRIVMLAPPNRPATMATGLKRFWPYQWIMGESGQKLGDAKFYETLPVPDVEFGVIGGDKGLPHLKGANDGIVVLESTKLDGMSDWVVVHRSHTFIMNSKETLALTLEFLREGRFKNEETAADPSSEEGADGEDAEDAPASDPTPEGT